MQKFLLSFNEVAEFKKVGKLTVALMQRRRGFSIRHAADLPNLLLKANNKAGVKANEPMHGRS